MRERHYVHGFTAMGSPCEIQLFAADSAVAQRAIAAVIADVERLEQRYSRYRESSFLSEINRVAAVGGRIEVDDETSSLLDYAATCYRQSDGLFDITSGLLRRAWNFKSRSLPDRALVDELLSRVGWDKIRWEPPALSFDAPGMELDFGGVVKEYAADRAATICRQSAISGAMVNLGGDIAIAGSRPDGDAWRIGLQHPRSPGEIARMVGLREGGLASSGDYARCIVVAGVRYGHILNPRSGWPVRNMAAVSVAAPLCVIAGSACTIAMLKDEEGPAWLAQLGLPHLWVSIDGEMGGPLAQ